MTGDDIGRRSFLELAGSVILLGGARADLDGGVAQQLEADPLDELGTGDAGDLDVYGLVLGSRPTQGAIDAEWDTYRLVHINTDTGVKSYITHESRGWQEIPMPIPQTQLDEVRVENYTSFFDHTFARPEAPDEKDWVVTGTVTKQGPEVELDPTATLETNQHGNYPPGTEAIAGMAMRLTGEPTGGVAHAGYFNAQSGFGVGEDTTDSFVFIRNSGTDYKVYREDWNGFIPDDRVWVSDTPVITRMPHLYYGGGAVNFRAVIHSNGETRLQQFHRITPANLPDTWPDGPPFEQPNLPIEFSTDSLTGGALRANAAHYERGDSLAETRVNGEHFNGVSVPTNDWVPLLSWQKRTNWDMVNIQPLSVAVNAITNDIKLELQLDSTLSGATFSLATHTSSSETAVEVTQNGNQGSISTDGERRWAGFAPSGSGPTAGAASIADLRFSLPNDQTVTLAAQAISNTATAEGVVTWEEFY